MQTISVDILNDFIPKNNKSNKENNETQNAYRIDKNTQMIIHTISPKDTLQGIAFKYGVTVWMIIILLISFTNFLRFLT